MTHLPLYSRTKLTTWLGLVVIACVASLAIVPVASAKQAPKNVVHRHFLKLYKVEKVVDVEGDETVNASVNCSLNDALSNTDNDLAVDGMWKVVDVDQNDAGGRDLTVLKAYEAWPDQDTDAGGPDIEDPAEYDFTFKNTSEERAQLKIYVTCLGWKTAENSHQHNWNWDLFSDHDDAANLTAAAAPDSTAPETQGATACSAGELAVSPGFSWNSGSGYGDIWKSRFNSPGDGLSWKWGFFVRTTGLVQFGHRCLSIPTSSFSSATIFNHFHNLEWEFADGGFSPPDTTFANGEVETRTRACDEHYKLMLHQFDLSVDYSANPPGVSGITIGAPEIAAGKHLWFLGMDPRVKKRAYKIYNGDTVNDLDGKLGGVCFHDRTGRRKKV